MSHTAKSNDRPKKRRILWICLSLFLLACLGGLLLYLFTGEQNEAPTEKELVEAYYTAHRLEFADPDAAVLPEDDANYLEQYDRRIMYEEFSTTEEISLLYPPSDEAAVTVLHFVLTTMEGDADGYNLLFTEEYLRENGCQSAFHAQKIYNIRIVRGARASDGSSCRFEVLYSIKDNDGTLRRDIVSDRERPIVLTLERTDRGYRISSLSYVFRNS